MGWKADILEKEEEDEGRSDGRPKHSFPIPLPATK